MKTLFSIFIITILFSSCGQEEKQMDYTLACQLEPGIIEVLNVDEDHYQQCNFYKYLSFEACNPRWMDDWFYDLSRYNLDQLSKMKDKCDQYVKEYAWLYTQWERIHDARCNIKMCQGIAECRYNAGKICSSLLKSEIDSRLY